MKTILIIMIRAYQVISRGLKPVLDAVFVFRSGCRYEKTCSEYAITRIIESGVLRGTAEAFFRVVSCNPFMKPVKRMFK